MCVSLHEFMQTTCIPEPMEARGGCWALGARGKGSCELLCVCWELNTSSGRERRALKHWVISKLPQSLSLIFSPAYFAGYSIKMLSVMPLLSLPNPFEAQTGPLSPREAILHKRLKWDLELCVQCLSSPQVLPLLRKKKRTFIYFTHKKRMLWNKVLHRENGSFGSIIIFE